jgi:tetratricopeptide (TPR) repeat protein
MNQIYENFVYKHDTVEIERIVNENIKDDDVLNSYMALGLALKRNLPAALQKLSLVKESELSGLAIAVYFEAKAVISYFQGNMDELKKYAMTTLDINENAFFARLYLARNEIFNRNYESAINLNRKILELYPGQSAALLNLAEALFLNKGKYEEIINYIKQAKWSFRRIMYYLIMLLFRKSALFSFFWIMFIFFLFAFSASPTGIFLAITLLVVLTGIFTLLKLRLDVIIISYLLLFQIIITLFWLLARGIN